MQLRADVYCHPNHKYGGTLHVIFESVHHVVTEKNALPIR